MPPLRLPDRTLLAGDKGLEVLRVWTAVPPTAAVPNRPGFTRRRRPHRRAEGVHPVSEPGRAAPGIVTRGRHRRGFTPVRRLTPPPCRAFGHPDPGTEVPGPGAPGRPR